MTQGDLLVLLCVIYRDVSLFVLSPRPNYLFSPLFHLLYLLSFICPDHSSFLILLPFPSFRF